MRFSSVGSNPHRTGQTPVTGDRGGGGGVSHPLTSLCHNHEPGCFHRLDGKVGKACIPKSTNRNIGTRADESMLRSSLTPVARSRVHRNPIANCARAVRVTPITAFTSSLVRRVSHHDWRRTLDLVRSGNTIPRNRIQATPGLESRRIHC